MRRIALVKPSFVPKSLAVLAATFVMSLVGSASATPLYDVNPSAIDGFACNGSGCWTNYNILADIDNDGDLDIIEPNYSGFFGQGGPQPLVIYTNTGNGDFLLASSVTVNDFSGRLRQVAVADVTGDGYVDIFAPDGYNGEGGFPDAFFINQGDGSFIDEAETRLPEGQAYAGATRFGDLDGDGDLDIFVADGYAQGPAQETFGRVLLNDGTGVFTVGGSVPSGAEGSDPDDVDLLDFDRDFDLDVLINMHEGKSSLWENDGAGNFTDVTTQFVGAMAGFHYNAGVCDVDGDGDLDVWTDNMAPDYQEQLAINDGSGNFTDETETRVTGNMSGADDNGVACADVDGDGDFDAVIFNLFTGSPNDPRVERVLYNDGAGNFTGSTEWDEFTNTSDATLWGDGADLDNDGRLDWVTAQGEQAGPARVYMGNDNMPQDATPPRIIAVEAVADPQTPEATPVVRFAVSDEVVSDMGPRLDSAFVRVTVDGGSPTDVPAGFIGGDLFRAELPAQAAGASVEYQACAIDRRDNEACSDPVTYSIESEPGDGDGDTTGDGDGDTAGDGDGDTADESGDESGDETVGDDEVGEAGEAGADDDGGCGCTSDTDQRGGLLALFGLAGLVALRRRREPSVG